ncbi:TPA: IS4 family transposase [bacterium]|nr:IS4 family transposase [bacterium]
MNTTMSLFRQVLSIVDKDRFQKAVNIYNADKGAKGFSTWDMFVSMMFCHLGQAKSLREICYGLMSAEGRLSHLGVRCPPSKSNLAYANAHRPWQVFQSVFQLVLGKCYEQSPGKKSKFRFKNELFSLDATTIDLCLNLFPWAKFRQTKGAVKLHLLLDHDGYLPCFVNITDGKTHEVNIAKGLELPKGSIVAMDKGYIDYEMLQRWTHDGVYFVTRLKDNADFKIVERRSVSGQVRADWTIAWNGYMAKHHCYSRMRVVKYWHQDKKENLYFLTNNFHLSAKTIAAIYKDRWEIELFFKTIKQNLRIKTFVGTSPNALKVQIWTALISILILKFLQFRSHMAWSMSNLVALLRMNLMVYADLWEWLERKWADPIQTQENPQLTLCLGQHIEPVKGG